LRDFRLASSATCSSADLFSLLTSSPSAVVVAVDRRLAEQLSANEISRSPEVRCGAPSPMEALERSRVVWCPFLPTLAVSPLSFFHLSVRVLKAFGFIGPDNHAATQSAYADLLRGPS
jgi:hypothetical protein